MGGVLPRKVREQGFPPCFLEGDQCGTTNNQAPTNQSIVDSLAAIKRKIVGAKNKADAKIKSDMESRWIIVLIDAIDVPAEAEDALKLPTCDGSNNFCTKIHNVYERLNELANYIEFLCHHEAGPISSKLETNMNNNFIEWQDQIYLCMCEMKLLLRSLNCDPCTTVPSGNLSAFFKNGTGSESTVDQQKAAYWLVLKGINLLTGIRNYL